MRLRFIGFYNYTVLLTYLSLISSAFGMTQAIHGHYKTAISVWPFPASVTPLTAGWPAP